MNSDTFKLLLTKYFNGECSEEELKMLAESVKKSDNDKLSKLLESVWMEYNSSEVLSGKESKKILSNIINSENIEKKSRYWSLRRKWFIRSGIAAALALICFGIGSFIKNSVKEESIIITAKPVNLSENVSYVRHVILPDSSMIVLQANSTIEILSDFKGKTREIRLTGEAYFDIKKDVKRPFIIYSSELKTTVLGTAFNISAWPDKDQIQVTVTRGKVRVENTQTKRIIADLTPSEKIEYRKTKIPEIKHIDTVEVKRTVEWIKQDMEFKEMSLKDIAVILSKRYNVDIEIQGTKLANTLVVASFVGTESLKDILEILCSINSSSYTLEDDKVTIYQD
jgi:ferric-dicitrate binding protein FerR (iron transport regulator)